MAVDKRMDVSEVRKIANAFEDAANVLEKVSKAVTAAIGVVSGTALLGNFAAPKIIKWLRGINRAIKDLVKESNELHNDLEAAISEHVAAGEDVGATFEN